jgi:hypothetical protein
LASAETENIGIDKTINSAARVLMVPQAFFSPQEASTTVGANRSPQMRGGMKMSDNLVDPLLVLLRRHESANMAFDAAVDRNASEAEKDHLFAACGRTMHAIIERVPAATTAEGAAAALDHVLNDESLWHGSEFAGEVFLRQLIEPARDYITRTAKE